MQVPQSHVLRLQAATPEVKGPLRWMTPNKAKIGAPRLQDLRLRPSCWWSACGWRTS